MKQSVTLLVAMVLTAVVKTQADTIFGKVWSVPEAVAQNAIATKIPKTPPDATFSVRNGPIDFESRSGSDSDYTVQDFLAFGGASCVGSYCTSLLDDGVHGTLMELVGTLTVTTGQSFTVTHDDGLTLIIGGIIVGSYSAPNSTENPPTMLTWTGPRGNFPFELVYGECCGPRAFLEIQLPLTRKAPIPEPSTLSLVGTGLGGLLWAGRRLRSRR